MEALKEFENKLNLCNDCRCGFCREGCPVYFGTDKQSIVAPKGRNQAMAAALKGDIGWSDRLLESAFICTTCGWCVEVCPQNNFLGHIGVNAPLHMPSLNTSFRDALLSEHKTRMPAGAKFLCDSVEKNGSVFRISKKKRTAWSRGLGLKETSPTIFFASCMSETMGFAEWALEKSESLEKVGLSYERLAKLLVKLQSIGLDSLLLKPLLLFKSNKDYTESLTNAVNCLRDFGIDFGYLGEEEPCCGAPFHTYGQYSKFKKHAETVYEQLHKKGVKRMITLNPICGAIMRNYYPQVVPEWDIEVRHFSEVLQDNIQDQELSFTGIDKTEHKKLKVVFHDPCHLARHQRVVDPPRKILEKMKDLDIVEPTRTKLNSRCAGCGGLEATHPKIAKKIAEDRTKELLSTGADYVVTSCPACVMMIRIGAKSLGRDLKPIEISDVLWKSLSNKD
jgi:Fe-S oxidoreductase